MAKGRTLTCPLCRTCSCISEWTIHSMARLSSSSGSPPDAAELEGSFSVSGDEGSDSGDEETLGSSSSGRDGREGEGANDASIGGSGSVSSKGGAGVGRPLGADVSDTMQLIDREQLTFQRSAACELGSGSSGTVYKGVYTRPGGAEEEVAIKCVRASSREAADSERFRRELKLVSRLADENVVKFVGVAWDDEGDGAPPTILLVTELMRGGTLRSALAGPSDSGHGGLDIHSFLSIATSVATGLVYLHEEGYAHRDIKSANVLLSERQVAGTNGFPPSARAKIADFGLSKSIDKLTDGAACQASVMEPGRLEATYAYLAPEAFGGDKTNVRNDDDDEQRLQETAKKRDIYALGILFWEMITGQVPWRGTSLPDVYVRVCVRSDRPTPTLEDTKVPKTLRRLVERCWAQDAKKRPSASSIVDKLQRITARLKNVTNAKAPASPPFSATAAAVSAGAMATLACGRRSSASAAPTTTSKVIAGDGARRKRDEAEAEAVSTSLAPSAQLRRRASSRATGARGEDSSMALVTKMRSHHFQRSPGPSTPHESSRDNAKISQPTPVTVFPETNLDSPPSSPPRPPRQLRSLAQPTHVAVLPETNLDSPPSSPPRPPRQLRSLAQPTHVAVLPETNLDSPPSSPPRPPRQLRSLAKPTHVAVLPETNLDSPPPSPPRPPRQPRNPKRSVARGGSGAPRSPTEEMLPRLSSGAVDIEEQRARQLDRPRQFASTPGEASVPNLKQGDVGNGEAQTRPTERPSKREKMTSAVFRSPSYGGPVTTSEALTGNGKAGADIGRDRSMLSTERRLHSVIGPHENGAARISRNSLHRNRSAPYEGDGIDEPELRQTGGDAPDESFPDFPTALAVHQMDTATVLESLGSEKRAKRLAALALAALTTPQHSSNDEILRASCAALHRVSVPTGYSGKDNKSVPAQEQLAIRKFLKYNEGISIILRVLDTPDSRHPTTLSYALLAIGNLTAWDLDAHKQFREARGVIQVSDCMKAHRRHLGVQEKGCYALACAAAAYPPRSKNEFLEAGCVDFVANVLESAARNDRLNDAVAKQACAALGAMCAGNPTNAARAALDGSLGNLIKAFDAFRSFSRTDGGKRNEMHLVCTAFMNLMCHNDNRRQAGNEGGTSLMIRSMRLFRLDADFVEKCLSTLSEFCTFRTNASHIVQMNGVDDIIASMVRFKTSVPVQRAGCRTLSALMKASGDQARRRVVHASGSEAILFALERFGAASGVHAAVAVEGCRAIAALCGMENAEEGEILARRMKKNRTDRAIKQTLQAHRGNQAVEDKAKEALKKLSSLKSGSNFFSRIRRRG